MEEETQREMVETLSKAAFPVNVDKDKSEIIAIGLSKRELFAAMAMQGLLSQGIPGQHNMMGVVVSESLKHADALIEELNKTNKQQ